MSRIALIVEDERDTGHLLGELLRRWGFDPTVLVERLVSLGVRYLVDTTNLFWLTNGLRHFQQMVGFSVVRIRVGRPRRGKHAVRQEEPAPTRAPVAAQAAARSVSPQEGN